jgi:hypothetical protein
VRAAAEGGAALAAPLTEQGRAARDRAVAAAVRAARDQVPRMVDVALDLVDLDGVLARVDVDGIVRRVDVQAIVDRVDVDAIVQRVDVEGVVDRVDIDAIVGNTEVGSLIVRSTSGAAAEVLDVVRSQGVGLDAFVFRLVNRVLRRDPASLPIAPSDLTEEAAGDETAEASTADAATEGDDAPGGAT